MPKKDMLTGGLNTFSINLETFYKHWMPSQKNEVYSLKAEEYKAKILKSSEIAPPILQGIDFEGNNISIRTADGRHRIAGAKAAGLSAIYVQMSDESITLISKLFPGVILDGNQTKNLDEEDETTQDNFRFFQAYLESRNKYREEHKYTELTVTSPGG